MMPQNRGWIQDGSDEEIVWRRRPARGCPQEVGLSSVSRKRSIGVLALPARLNEDLPHYQNRSPTEHRARLIIDFCTAGRIIPLFARRAFLDSFPSELCIHSRVLPRER